LFGLRIDVVKEILVTAGINLSEKDFLWIFAHSKMQIIDEEKDRKMDNNKLINFI